MGGVRQGVCVGAGWDKGRVFVSWKGVMLLCGPRRVPKRVRFCECGMMLAGA